MEYVYLGHNRLPVIHLKQYLRTGTKTTTLLLAIQVNSRAQDACNPELWRV